MRTPRAWSLTRCPCGCKEGMWCSPAGTQWAVLGQLRVHTPKPMPREADTTCRTLDTNVHSSIPHSGPKVETTQWMNKETKCAVSSKQNILRSLKGCGTNTLQPWKHRILRRKPGIKGHVLHFHLMRCPRGQSCGSGQWTSLGWGRGSAQGFSWGEDVFRYLTVVTLA